MDRIMEFVGKGLIIISVIGLLVTAITAIAMLIKDVY